MMRTMSVSYNHGFNIYSGVIGLDQAAKVAGTLKADTIRVAVNWSDLQPTSTGPMNSALLDSIRNVVLAGRLNNPSMNALVIFDQAPTWADGYAIRGVATSTGFEQYSGALTYLAQYLTGTHPDITNTFPPGDSHRTDVLRGIELSNEANTNNPSFNGAIPSGWYGGMAAYAAHRLYYCAPGKLLLIGALATGTGSSYADGTWQNWIANVKSAMYAWLLWVTNDTPTAQAIYGQWRLSFHPYPHLGQWYQTSGGAWLEPTNPSNPTGDLTSSAADLTVNGIVNDALTQAAGHKVWITETGISSRKMNNGAQNGEAQQAQFAQLQHNRIAGNSQIEGLVFWPVSDTDNPQVASVGNTSTHTGGEFFRLGVVWDDGYTPKQAGSLLQGLWT